MYGKVKEHLCTALENLKSAGLYKEERIIESPQGSAIQVKGKEVLNFCANNYLGLSNHPRLIEGAKKTCQTAGFFICSPAPPRHPVWQLSGPSGRGPL